MENPTSQVLKLVVLIFLSAISGTWAQKLEENKKDEFTNNVVKRTSWEPLKQTMKDYYFFRITKINEVTYFDFKMMVIGGKVFSINKGQELMFKLSNDEIVKLSNLEYTISCKGCGAKGLSGSEAEGIQVSYIIEESLLEKLKSGLVVKLRVYTTDGYREEDIKEKNAATIKAALTLVD